VTVADLCGNEKIGTTTIQPSAIPNRVNSIEIVQDNSGFCKDATVSLTARVNGQPTSINWSNSSTGQTVKVPGVAGTTIKATAKATCGDREASVTLAEIDPVCVRMPKIFFPESNLITDAANDNKTFRVNTSQCGTSPISNYELKIFNRWGQEVFGTTDINAKWDGKYSGNNVPPDVYVYYIRYNQNDCTLDRKSDLTLVR
jgi:gliding motility-associated-like protein